MLNKFSSDTVRKIDKVRAGNCGLHDLSRSINMWWSSGVRLCISHSNYSERWAITKVHVQLISRPPPKKTTLYKIHLLAVCFYSISRLSSLIPFVITWWALQMRSRSWRLRNLLTTSAPKVKETPRSFSPQPCTSLSGSDHSRSHSRPKTHTHTHRGEEEISEEKGACNPWRSWERKYRQIQLTLLM